MFKSGLKLREPKRDLSLNPKAVITCSPEQTIALGKELASSLPDGTILCLEGELGAGKTTLIKGLASQVTGCPVNDVASPTFVYLHIYEGTRRFFHFDLYRLSGSETFLEMGFDEFFYAGGICAIEWADRILPILPPNRRVIRLRHLADAKREISYE